MDLYGDLPPTLSGDKVEVSNGSWSNLVVEKPPIPAKAVIATVSQTQPVLDKISKTADSQSIFTQSNKIVPSAAKKVTMLFKPRQAVAGGVKLPSKPITKKQDESIIPKRPRSDSFQVISDTTDVSTTLEEPHGFNFDCIDPYDPHKPNDYLKFCEERQEELRLEKVAEENELHLLEVEKLRQVRDKERIEATEKGDIQKLQTMLSGGRGRGRGLSNLPSWMTENLSRSINSTSAVPSVSNTEQIVTSSRFADLPEPSSDDFRNRKAPIKNPSKVLLIKYVKANRGICNKDVIVHECQRYGKVLNIDEHDVNDPNSSEDRSVRVFVEYERIDESIRAYRDLTANVILQGVDDISFYDFKKYQTKLFYP